MANASALPTSSLIESATTLFGNGLPDSGPSQETRHRPNLSFNARQEQAMARRLEQIQSALGAPETSSNLSLVPAPTVEVAQRRRQFSARSLVVACLLSGFTGASLTWLTTNQEAPAFQPAIQESRLAAPAATVPAPVAKAIIAPAPEITDEQQVRNLLDSWRNAWAKSDVPTYLNAYSSNFMPADGSTRDVWAATRSSRLSSGKHIDVQVNALTVERIDDQTFRASFLQDYASGSYRENARPKTMRLAREGNTWKIIEERQLDMARPTK